MARREKARRARVLLQRPRDHVFLRSLPDFRAGRLRRIPDRGRRPGSPRRALTQGPCGPRAAHGRCAGERRGRYFRFSGSADRPRRAFAAMRHADYIRLGRTEGAEEIMWLAMRGALSPRAKKIHENYYLPMTTAMAVALFEEPQAKLPASGKASARTSAKMSS